MGCYWFSCYSSRYCLRVRFCWVSIVHAFQLFTSRSVCCLFWSGESSVLNVLALRRVLCLWT
jgi:hypothetical protein